MSSNASLLPESREELAKIIDSLTTKNEQLEEKVRWFEEQFHLARHKQFGTSSERSVKEQQYLFNEAEAIAEAGPAREPVASALQGLRQAHRRDHRFARLLNFLVFRLIPGAWRRDLVMTAVYRLSESCLARFYAGRQTGWDRLAMLLATARLLPSAPTTPRPLIGENP